MNLKYFFILIILLLSSPSHAEKSIYVCEVKSALYLSENGTFKKREGNYGVGKKFIVDRSTGEMKGELTNNTGFSKLVLLNKGNSVQSLAAITTNRSSKTASYIYVQEFSKNQLKPFFYVDFHHIYSGTCSSL